MEQNMERVYERATLVAVTFEAMDIITTSGWASGVHTPIVMPEDIF